jgi:hypothetical protein
VLALSKSRLLLALVPAVLVGGCAEDEGRAWINARLTEGEAMIAAIDVRSSADGAELEVDWGMELVSRSSADCPVAVYRWLDALPEGNELPSVGPGESWPAGWAGGELVDDAVLEAGGELSLGPTRLDEPRDERVGGLIGLATCPDSSLDAEIFVEAEADLGVRAVWDALTVEIWRAG